MLQLERTYFFSCLRYPLVIIEIQKFLSNTNGLPMGAIEALLLDIRVINVHVPGVCSFGLFIAEEVQYLEMTVSLQ